MSYEGMWLVWVFRGLRGLRLILGGRWFKGKDVVLRVFVE